MECRFSQIDLDICFGFLPIRAEESIADKLVGARFIFSQVFVGVIAKAGDFVSRAAVGMKMR